MVIGSGKKVESQKRNKNNLSLFSLKYRTGWKCGSVVKHLPFVLEAHSSVLTTVESTHSVDRKDNIGDAWRIVKRIWCSLSTGTRSCQDNLTPFRCRGLVVMKHWWFKGGNYLKAKRNNNKPFSLEVYLSRNGKTRWRGEKARPKRGSFCCSGQPSSFQGRKGWVWSWPRDQMVNSIIFPTQIPFDIYILLYFFHESPFLCLNFKYRFEFWIGEAKDF